ncbi:transcriptional corepressor SEUSS-like [Zingiber officinale]|uniref:transcriptional corepressor SEUSS-like n=1 Tax=Zingiber officinale TaxID=94328 RepID=UPI001C4B73A8|nr:transcriptional corepressor SEUSS-like [Zingiber officinale]
MVPSGSSNSIGGPQSVSPSLLRSNSGLLGGSQSGSIPSQPPFSSLASPHTQLNSNSLLGNITNIPPLSNSFGNGGPIGGLSSSSMSLQQRGGFGSVDTVGSAEPSPMSFTSSSGQVQGQQQCFQNPSNNQLGANQLQTKMDTMQNFQQQISLPQNQQQFLRGGLSNVGHVVPVKMEPEMGTVKLEPQMEPNNQIRPSQQLQSLCGIGAVKTESQQLQSLRSLGTVKIENQHSDTSMFLQQQQQQQHQQQILQLSRQNSQVAAAAAAAQMNYLQQQRILQLQQQQQRQQQQQQQIVKNLPQQRSQLQQQLLQQNLPIRTAMKSTMYEPGMCARRLTQYMYHQQHRPHDNNIEFWRKFIAEYFAPDAKKRWCVSLYGTGRQTTGVFPQDVWHCEICNHKPGRGFETTVEVLPRLFQIKYASGTIEELLYVDMPREYQNASGQIVLDYAKAIQESVFEQLRVVRDGQLRIVFNPDLKISSWEFCARHHEELIPRRVIVPQVSQLGTVVQRYQAATQNASSGLSTQDVQNTCNSFVASARQIAKALEVPLVNDLGYTKRYVRCLQISEVVNSMKDLIDFSKETGAGPMDSLITFPRRTSSGLQTLQPQQSEQPQIMTPNSNHNDPTSIHSSSMPISTISNDHVGMSNSLNTSSTSASAATVIGALQNPMNAGQENQMNTLNSTHAGNSIQIPSTSVPPSQPNASTFPSTKHACSNNPMPTSQIALRLNSNSPASLPTLQQPAVKLHDNDPNDSQSSVQQILQELMMSSQLNGVNSLENDVKPINGMMSNMNGANCLFGNVMPNDSAINSTESFTSMCGTGLPAAASGMRATMTNNALVMNGRMGTNHLLQDPTTMNCQPQDINNRLLDRFGAINNFNNFQFDWKPSP